MKYCNRRNCNNIANDDLICSYRICSECLSEFKILVGEKDRLEREFIKLFVDFIMSDKTVGSGVIISLDQFIKKKYNE